MCFNVKFRYLKTKLGSEKKVMHIYDGLHPGTPCFLHVAVTFLVAPVIYAFVTSYIHFCNPCGSYSELLYFLLRCMQGIL